MLSNYYLDGGKQREIDRLISHIRVFDWPFWTILVSRDSYCKARTKHKDKNKRNEGRQILRRN